MAYWGYKALDSDEGLQVIDFFDYCICRDCDLKLSKVISLMKGYLLGKDFKNIYGLYDYTAISLAEAYFQYKDKGKIRYKYEDGKIAFVNGINSFTANKSSLKYLLRLLNNIKNHVHDEDGNGRDIIEEWEEKNDLKKWERILNKFIERIKEEINNLE